MTESHCVSEETPLGPVWVWTTDVGLCGLGFGEAIAPSVLRRLAGYGVPEPDDARTTLHDDVMRQLRAYFDRDLRRFDLPLDMRGTEFQHRVWLLLQAISYGDTTTYGDLALLLGKPRASQAVGQAVGANPVSIVVPCHRVVAHDGKLTGYAYGVPRKAALLALEQTGQQLRIEFG